MRICLLSDLGPFGLVFLQTFFLHSFFFSSFWHSDDDLYARHFGIALQALLVSFQPFLFFCCSDQLISLDIFEYSRSLFRSPFCTEISSEFLNCRCCNFQLRFSNCFFLSVNRGKIYHKIIHRMCTIHLFLVNLYRVLPHHNQTWTFQYFQTFLQAHLSSALFPLSVPGSH